MVGCGLSPADLTRRDHAAARAIKPNQSCAANRVLKRLRERRQQDARARAAKSERAIRRDEAEISQTKLGDASARARHYKSGIEAARWRISLTPTQATQQKQISGGFGSARGGTRIAGIRARGKFVFAGCQNLRIASREFVVTW